MAGIEAGRGNGVLRLNLGACGSHLPQSDGWVNVDHCPPADVLWDLSVAPWPWEDSTVDYILASHIVEHLPDKILTMNEAHRVLKPGGVLKIAVPSTKGAGAWCDPQHQSYWNATSFDYFEVGNICRERFCRAYGISAAFRIVQRSESMYSNRYDDIWIVEAELEAVK